MASNRSLEGYPELALAFPDWIDRLSNDYQHPHGHRNCSILAGFESAFGEALEGSDVRKDGIS